MRNDVLLATTFAASLAFIAPAHADFTIGIIAPLTGPGAADGNEVKSAMQTAADEINRNGGILGDKLVLKFGDDASDPLKSSSVAKEFLNEKINFVIEAAVFDPPPLFRYDLSRRRIFWLSQGPTSPDWRRLLRHPNSSTVDGPAIFPPHAIATIPVKV